MFSWVCKGCGHELVQGELVRLNGQEQLYDGYGGSAASVCDYNPSAWHNRCYLKAILDANLDETPSNSAPNQGFGEPKLEFLPGFKDNDVIKYTVTVNCWYQIGEDKYADHELVLTNQDKLEDQKSWHNVKTFSSIDEAILAVEAILQRDLPSQCEGEYQLFIFGFQKGIGNGVVFERIVDRWDRSGKIKLPELVTKIVYRKDEIYVNSSK